MDSCQSPVTASPETRDLVVPEPLAGHAERPRHPAVAGLLCTSALKGQAAREQGGRGVFTQLLLEILHTATTPGGPWEHVIDVDFATGRRSVEVAALVHAGGRCGLPLCTAVLERTDGHQHPRQPTRAPQVATPAGGPLAAACRTPDLHHRARGRGPRPDAGRGRLPGHRPRDRGT